MGSFKSFYHKHLILCHALFIVVVAVFLCFFTMFFLDVWTNHGRTTVVPEVRKKSYTEATEILDKSHLKYEIADSVYDSSTPPGTVKEIWPHPGTRVKPGRQIYLTINSFQPQRITVTMPLTGVSSRQAITYLESLNIKNVRIVYVPSDFPDLVEGARYKGKSIVPGMQIPVNADIVLEVGTLRQKPAEPVDGDAFSASQLDEAITGEIEQQHHDNQHHEPQHAAEPQHASEPDIFD